MIITNIIIIIIIIIIVLAAQVWVLLHPGAGALEAAGLLRPRRLS